ncbi:probable ATP-dependent RNA helicase DDX31 isoform X1 [Ahaetulla prasina]|uniref:probable ATP-dependent RNA helicase DDX31 isoform X1 n=1 Tax=Ahaetulla prasina TaxID=499056 RepID=UPI002648FC92|nr:probable ATP-dependent RNA helicase DDX31 isoform X1 [Ahaetulla prasina]
MASDEGLLINVSTLPLPGSHRFPAGQRAPNPQWGRRGKKAMKRTSEGAQETTPVKKQRASPMPQTKKPWKNPKNHNKGTGPPGSSLEKLSLEAREGDFNKRPFVKTSSLFKNNPEIPDLQRTAVKQVQEEIFTSDSFDQLGLHPHLTSTITSSLKLSSMTSVQKETIPTLLQGKDARIRSQTGSGKTLAYSIPLVQSLQKLEPKIKRSDGPYALILVPTRELVLQSFETLQKLLKPFTWIVPGVLMGGEKKKSEKARLRKGINILVATPGRLVDHIKSTQCIHFRCIRWLILDEADRILDLGFEKAVAAILNAVNAASPKRQNVLLSATLSEGVSRLAHISLQDPACITVASEAPGSNPAQEKVCLREDVGVIAAKKEQGSFAVPETLRQNVVMVPSKLRLVTLAAFIYGKFKFEKRHKMIVFFSSREQVEFHYVLFQKVLGEASGDGGSGLAPALLSPLSFARLHGDMKQEERSSVFQAFLQSKTGVLLCTDVAARGLDLPQVTWIVQYNPAASLAEYVHRIGRTARIGSPGNSLLMLLPSEAGYVSFLASYKINISEMKMEEILSNLTKDDRFKGNPERSKKSLRRDVQEIHRRATVMQTEFEDFVHSGTKTTRWAKKALQSFIRSYATYPANLKPIFHIRALHLGHVAKSFGLRDAPGNLGAVAGAPWQGRKQKRRDPLKTAQVIPRLHVAFEYSSGLDPSASKGKRKKRLRNRGELNSPS